MKKRIEDLCKDENLTINKIKEFCEEINYEVSGLKIEAKKLSNLKIMKGVSWGVFTISLGALLIGLPGIAGILGSTSLYNIFKEYMDGKSKNLDLKKSPFYIPFLFQKLAEK